MKIEKIPRDILGAVRQNLGGESPDDISRDLDIMGMSPKELMICYSKWYIGSDWASEFIDSYERLQELDASSTESVKENKK